MIFTYKALKDNKQVTGKIDANNTEEAVSLLKAGGFFPIEVKKEGAGSSALTQIFDRVDFTDIVNFTRQLSIMLNAGVTLIDAFDIFKKQSTKPSFMKMIEQMDKEVRGGKTFSETLRAYPHLFSNLYISLVKAGEASGKLNDILLNLSQTLEKQRELRGRVTGAFIYPALILSGMVIVIFIMVTFVIPKLLGLYKDLNVKLPWSTQIIVYVSDFLSQFWYLVIIGFGVGAYLVYNFFQSPRGKKLFDKYILKVPVISNVLIQSMLVDTTRALAILVGSGVSILDALQIVKEGNPNGEFRSAFSRIAEKVEKGVSLGNAFKEEPVFPPLIIQMAIVGEQTGHLDETMRKISEYFDIESELAIKNMTTLIEPTVLVILGLGVGFLIFSVITPIYSLTSTIQ
jgi:type II secretory pathway component PulF